MAKNQYMSLEEFKTSGLLQECNRQFMHPLGVSLGIGAFADGEVRLFVIDKREEKPEGCIWQDFGIAKEGDFLVRSQYIVDQQERVAGIRRGKFGWFVEPLQNVPAPPPPRSPDDEPTISMA